MIDFKKTIRKLFKKNELTFCPKCYSYKNFEHSTKCKCEDCKDIHNTSERLSMSETIQKEFEKLSHTTLNEEYYTTYHPTRNIYITYNTKHKRYFGYVYDVESNTELIHLKPNGYNLKEFVELSKID